MNRSKFENSPFTSFEIHQINSTGKIRDSPTSSILKTPTPIFVTTRRSSAKTKKLKFANGPVDLSNLKNGSYEPNVSLDSGIESNEDRKFNNGEIVFEDSVVEVAISPGKTMQVSPESWRAYQEYKKYSDYPNETEKTDYTYSRLSKFRDKEIIPGFSIRPNLSRLSIHSRRSSVFLPSHRSTSFNESSLSEGYDLKIYDHLNSKANYDFKVPNQSNKFKRSKYYLRSSSFDGANTNEVDVSPNYVEYEYYNTSAPEISESVVSSQDDGGAHYYTKTRSMYLDDADIDEVDDDSGVYEKNYYSGSGISRSTSASASTSSRDAGKNLWMRPARPTRDSTSQTVPQYLSNFFTMMFLYVTSAGTKTKDLFSKYVLRRKDDWSQSSSSSSYPGGWRSDGLKYSSTGGWVPHIKEGAYSTGGWAPHVKEGAYSSTGYYSGGYYDYTKPWYQRMFYGWYDKARTLLWGSSAGYAASRYYEPSRKRKWWWLLIPLLLLMGLGLYKAEQDNGFLSEQYMRLNCKTNGFLTLVEDTVKPMWRSGYVTYKRAASSLSCYLNESWDRLMLPFTFVNEWLCSKLSLLSETSLGFLVTGWNALWGGLRNFLTLTHDAFSNLWLFLWTFFSDFISAGSNLLYHICRYLMNGLSYVSSGLGAAMSSLYLLLFAPRQTVRYDYAMPDAAKEVCSKQQKSIDLLSNELKDFKSISADLYAMKKKIDDLELEFKQEKESRQNFDEFHNRKLDENHKTLQKYQAMVNNALLSSKRPSQMSGSSIQYFLDSQSDALKQWITQNFLLKSDSANIDEDKLGLLIAKHSNSTGEELLALKREFGQFALNHKNELEVLKNSLNTYEKNAFEGSDVSVSYIKKLIADAIKLYDADKTGKVDYALETAGGQIQSIRCTETYMASPKSYVLLGWAVYTKTSNPRDAISPGMAAGQCWAFVGSQGFLVIQLSHTIKVTGFTMEHISKSLVPKGHIESAPKKFSMWGLKSEHDPEPYLFGEYTYLDNGETLQYFPVTYPTSESYKMVELKITSNHGNPDYTCLYRIRVHGEPESP